MPTLCLLVASLLTAAEPPTKEQIERLVKQLGDGDFDKREEASKQLWKIGEAAEEALRKGLKSDDAEVRRRADELLDKFKWGVYPDTPIAIVDLIGGYQSGTPEAKAQIIPKLFAAGAPGCKALLKIAKIESNDDVLALLHEQINASLSIAVPGLLTAGDYPTLEALVELSARQKSEMGPLHHAAYWLLRGKADDRVKALKDGLAGWDKARQAEALAYLQRARGDLDAALTAADKADKPELGDALLFEARRWKDLLRRGAVDRIEPEERPGYQVAFHRLAGDPKAFADAVADLIKQAGEKKEDDSALFLYAKALLFNGKPTEGVDLLIKGRQRTSAFEVLIAQFRYKEAFDLVEALRKEAGNEGEAELPALELLEARVRHGLGEKDKAKEIFTRYADRIKEGDDFSWYQNLIEAEANAGAKGAAFEHAAKVLSVSRDMGWPDRLFPDLFGDRSEAALALWRAARQKSPETAPADTLKQVRDLVEKKLKPDAVKKHVEDAMASTKDLQPEEAEALLRGLAEVALNAGHDALARSCLEKAGTSAALTRLGDLHAEKKEWKEAAARYKQASDKEPGKPLPLYLHGQALVQAGQEKEGKKWIEQSHWLPLGDEAARKDFLDELAKRDQPEAVRRETDLLLKLSKPGYSYYYGSALRLLAMDLARNKDYLKAADVFDQASLRGLSRFIAYDQGGAYVWVPAYAHRLRARGLVAAGKFDEARREIAAAEALVPGDIELAILVVPALEKAGKKKDAAELFEKVMAVQAKLCGDYPKAGWTHNSVAWLAACCRRDLDRALDHAKKAVELEPDSGANHDTLAEVHFQRGDKDKAIAAQKKAIELEPRKVYFRKQLKRIEAGDPTADRPVEDDE